MVGLVKGPEDLIVIRLCSCEDTWSEEILRRRFIIEMSDIQRDIERLVAVHSVAFIIDLLLREHKPSTGQNCFLIHPLPSVPLGRLDQIDGIGKTLRNFCLIWLVRSLWLTLGNPPFLSSPAVAINYLLALFSSKFTDQLLNVHDTYRLLDQRRLSLTHTISNLVITPFIVLTMLIPRILPLTSAATGALFIQSSGKTGMGNVSVACVAAPCPPTS